MVHYCRVCGVNEVDAPGEICELCEIAQDPYAMPDGESMDRYVEDRTVYDSGDVETRFPGSHSPKRKILPQNPAALTNVDPYGNDMTPVDPSQVPVYTPGQMPPMPTSSVNANTNVTPSVGKLSGAGQPMTSGITKNIVMDTQEEPVAVKWFNAFFRGIPFSFDNEITMFQVYPDCTGSGVNALGNACDQVVVYGKVAHGAISENNDVEVYGYRDSNNYVVAREVRNMASGVKVTPTHAMSAVTVRVITLAVLILICSIFLAIGLEGIVWGIILIMCFMNLPLALKIVGVIFGFLYSMIKRLF